MYTTRAPVRPAEQPSWLVDESFESTKSADIALVYLPLTIVPTSTAPPLICFVLAISRSKRICVEPVRREEPPLTPITRSPPPAAAFRAVNTAGMPTAAQRAAAWRQHRRRLQRQCPRREGVAASPPVPSLSPVAYCWGVRRSGFTVSTSVTVVRRL